MTTIKELMCSCSIHGRMFWGRTFQVPLHKYRVILHGETRQLRSVYRDDLADSHHRRTPNCNKIRALPMALQVVLIVLELVQWRIWFFRFRTAGVPAHSMSCDPWLLSKISVQFHGDGCNIAFIQCPLSLAAAVATTDDSFRIIRFGYRWTPFFLLSLALRPVESVWVSR